MSEGLFIGRGETRLCLLPAMANRHGLIAGATGTGKTVTLQVLAEALSGAGVPVFMADIKGDLSGISQSGYAKPKLVARAEAMGLEFKPEACPVQFWDVLQEQGLPIRATVSDMGPLLFARLLNLNAIQEGVLQLAFQIADDQGLLLLDLKDLRALLNFLAEHAKDYSGEYGNLSAASLGAIQRGLTTLEAQGGDRFFGEPALALSDLMRVDSEGRGVVNILAADKLMQTPRVYATLLLWLLAELFEELPEVGDLEKPKLVFFFDEAHLLFKDAPKALVDTVEQVVRLIRSKGVGVFFVSQNPLDIPDVVLGQLGNRIQHALRAFTPRDQRAVKAAAQTLRANPNIDVQTAIGELGVGEALVSLLDEKATPMIVQRALIRPPMSRLGPIDGDERQRLNSASALRPKYAQAVDRESAYERLCARARGEAEAPARREGGEKMPETTRDNSKPPPRTNRDSPWEALAKSVLRSVGSSAGRQLGQQLVRGILGALLKS